MRISDWSSDVCSSDLGRAANPAAQGVTLRALGGNATSRALVLLDGVPQADPFFGYIPFNALVPDRLSVVRITRGGGAGPFGAGAVAGTIELGRSDERCLGKECVSPCRSLLLTYPLKKQILSQ